MHVLLVHQAFVSPNDAGGTRHYEFARRLNEDGHEVTIVASDLSYLSGRRIVRHRRIFSRESIDGISVLRAYTYASLHKSFRWRIVSFLSFTITSVIAGLRAGPVNLVFGTSPPIFQAVSAWLISVLRRRPFLLEIRDLWPEFAIDMGVLKGKLLIAMSRWLEIFLYRRAAHIIVNSPAYIDYLIGKGVPARKISLIPNGVDPAMFRADAERNRIRQDLGLDDKFVVTYAGALGMANDLPTVLRAAGRLKQDHSIHFLIVGDGKEGEKLRQIASEQQLNNVTFLGAQSKSRMPGFLAASDACVATLLDIPMFRTTYPNKVFDYMAAGKPTLLCIDGVIREVLDRCKGGIFCAPGNDLALVEAIKQLLACPSLAQSMGRDARAFVERHFDRRKQATDFIATLERVAGERS